LLEKKPMFVAKLTTTPLETGWPLAVNNVAVIVEDAVASDA
jgi:hypothetical protein